ncbi:MAG: type II toxin-antitoxin system RelE/ParE family toxin [Bacteroidales bacterium]|nr:type II toxin-antitoxin system RelE/ParE family toxin [Bacteroidales bacterium]
MSYSVELTDNFRKEAKKLQKKYPSLKSELEELGNLLSENPTTGTHLDNNVYKIRLAIKSKGKGKRGGTRVMTQVKIVNEKVYLFSIYNKGEKDDISDDEIRELIKDIL